MHNQNQKRKSENSQAVTTVKEKGALAPFFDDSTPFSAVFSTFLAVLTGFL